MHKLTPRSPHANATLLALALPLAALAGPLADSDVAPDPVDPPTADDATLFPVPDYAGDFWERAALTGDWEGLRTDLADNGFQLDLNPPELLGGFPLSVDAALDDPTGTPNFSFVLPRITFTTSICAIASSAYRPRIPALTGSSPARSPDF